MDAGVSSFYLPGGGFGPVHRQSSNTGGMMKFLLLLVISLKSIDAAAVSASRPAKVERVILFIIHLQQKLASER